MAEGILTASITSSGGVSFQTTAGNLEASAKASATKTFTFSYTPSFIICFTSEVQRAYNTATGTSSGWEVYSVAQAVENNESYSPIIMIASGGSATIFARTGSWVCSCIISLSDKTATLKAQGNGSYYCGARCCVYGAL